MSEGPRPSRDAVSGRCCPRPGVVPKAAYGCVVEFALLIGNIAGVLPHRTRGRRCRTAKQGAAAGRISRGGRSR
jgi:hypothetical protein